MDELMICVAPCPGDNQPERFPGELDVVAEVTRSCAAGASIAHLHVRDREGRQTIETSLFSRQVQDIRQACDIVIEGSTGGTPEHALAERCVSIQVPGVEMGSLNLGSINMAGGVYQNPMQEIRFYASRLRENSIRPSLCVFDLSMLNNAERLVQEGLLSEPRVYNLVFDVPDALPYDKRILRFFLDLIPDRSVWFVTRHHAAGWMSFRDALELGGHARVGYEDGPFLSTGERAKANAELVDEIAGAARQIGRKVVLPEEARRLLGLPGA